MLKHWEVCLSADPSLYLPFRGDYPGSVRGQHSLRLGLDHATDEGQIAEAKRYALSVFPEAEITAVWETNILGDRIRQV